MGSDTKVEEVFESINEFSIRVFKTDRIIFPKRLQQYDITDIFSHSEFKEEIRKNIINPHIYESIDSHSYYSLISLFKKIIIVKRKIESEGHEFSFFVDGYLRHIFSPVIILSSSRPISDLIYELETQKAIEKVHNE